MRRKTVRRFCAEVARACTFAVNCRLGCSSVDSTYMAYRVYHIQRVLSGRLVAFVECSSDIGLLSLSVFRADKRRCKLFVLFKCSRNYSKKTYCLLRASRNDDVKDLHSLHQCSSTHHYLSTLLRLSLRLRKQFPFTRT